MSTKINTSSNGGSISTTTTPQSATQNGIGVSSATSSNIQSIDASSLLSNSGTGGIPLKNIQVPTVNVGTSTTSTVSAKVGSSIEHHNNTTLIGIAVIIFVIIMIFFWRAFNSENNTTD
jgi:preprotein translocase subunit SecF